MPQRNRVGTAFIIFSWILAGWPGRAAAEEISPAIYLIIDTSGSMIWDPGQTFTNGCHGDGSAEHPETSGCTSRLHMAKNAVTTVVNSYPEVRWGLARFKQTEGPQYLCMCGWYSGRQNDVDPSEEPDSCDLYYSLALDLPNVIDRVCVNYSGAWGGSCGSGCCDWFTDAEMSAADVLVALADDNESTILMWVDQHENDFQTGTEPGTGNHCWDAANNRHGDCELRAMGATPLGGSLHSLYEQISNTDLGGDPVRGCRPYRIILLTDGEESCSGDPVAEATALRTTPDLQHTCSTNNDCPPNSTCSGGHCRYDVRTYVIAFATSSSALQKANDIANAGGTGSAVPAWNENDIVAAMAEVIADSLVSELCNGQDDDCDGLTDEDFPVGDACDNGLLGVCHATGTYVCDPSDPTSVVCQVPSGTPTPGANPEICNGLDDDCDGEIDEGGVCTCKGPELCNGLDDYCDTWASHAEGSEDPNVGQTCGTNVGACTVGTTYCWVDPADPSHVEIRCSGIDPQPEVCDSNTPAHDQNCNGTNNDGIAPQPCQKTNAYGTCQGQQTCDEDGNWTCWAKDPGPEICNNVDDDCDGQTDENLSRSCQVSNGFGTCSGTETCGAGNWGGCTAQTPAAETCNNVDDDCDGATDENLSRACQASNGFGTCSGTETCSAGSWVNCSAQTPAAESCNNIDDDCDGQTDENLSQTCYTGPSGTGGVGQCHSGNQSCSAGTWGACQGQQLPVTEVCDNLDNDCDGQTDEDLGQTSCGLGICNHTVQNCINGVPQTCDPYQGAGTETCNGLDDDCDGVVDGLQAPCFPYASGCTQTGGNWSCQGQCREGTRTCPAGGSGVWGICQGAVGPVAEDCNGLDDDCDGQTDENLTQACYPPGYGATTGCTAPGSCLGACREGSRVCSAGGWGACQGAVTPAAESCNNIDDDCDGQTDENLSRACQASNGFGTCTGVETCSAGSWGTCSARTPAAESCNNIDDDCDGQTDENLSRSCYGGPAGTQGVGECRAGSETCSAGSWGSCQGEVVPATETCNGLDDDCDGQTDESLTENCYEGPAGTEGVGQCHAGHRVCTNGNWGSCQNQVVPTTEVCNGLDDDCDGQTDEDLGSVTCGLGVCEHTVESCVNGTPVTCDPYEGAGLEVCNALDDDCDGVADGLQRPCYPFASGCQETAPGVWTCEGQCATGTETCAVGSGVWGSCQFAVGPAEEICDGVDNDCDGQTDEDDGGSPLTGDCYPPGSGQNTGCILDETSGQWSCLGECRVGTRTCTNAAWGQCSGEVTPAAEVCDNLDNDCDGQTDEPEDIAGLNQPCGTALGRCTPGILRCVNGQEICDGGEGPFDGVCNGLDDDCDGAIDEQDEVADEEGLPCGDATGVCEPGTTVCLGGQIVCQGGVQPTEEVCDGLDNNCNGETDDGAPCPPEYYCVQGDCRQVCDPNNEFSCPSGLSCVEWDLGGEVVDICLPETGDCGGQTCPDGWICENDTCVDPCDPNPCEAWQECQTGTCVDVSCTAVGHECPSGQVCVNHECQDDPCRQADCDPEEEFCEAQCSDTSCEAVCRPLCLCSPDERCDLQGQCSPSLCAQVECGYGQRCNEATGECEPDPCEGVYCQGVQACFEGDCVDDPCETTHCPPGFACELTDDDGQPVSVCMPDDSYWVGGRAGEEILATGTGGCACRAGGPADSGGLFFLLLVLGLVLRRGQGGER